MSYKPPLEIETDVEKIAEEAKAKDEEFVMKFVRSLSIKADKDELVKALAYDRDQYQKGYEDGYKDGCKDGKINSEVKHGEWETNSDRLDTFECSCCHKRYDMWYHESKNFKYCPACGCKMDLGE